jgi:hypothetical protein
MPVPPDFDFTKLASFLPSAARGEAVPFKRAAN